MAHVLTKLTIVPKTNGAEAAKLAAELGLKVQADRYEKPLAEHAFTPLTDDEATLWMHHCPTRYTTTGGERVRDLTQYAFDNVPVEVMRHWKAIKENYAFDRYEIWTTERTPATTDPLLVGFIGTKLYLLARWGLESPEAAPLKDIARSIHDAMLNKERWDFRNSTCPFFRSKERVKQINEDKALDWCLHHASNSGVFASCRRILGLTTTSGRYHYDYGM